MIPILYSYEKCSTCKRALALLKERNVSFHVRDIRCFPPSKDELKLMLHFMKGEVRTLFNTSGNLYRELQLSKKISSFSVEEAIHLLTQSGMLIKRPFFLGKNCGIVGFQEKKWQNFLERNEL
jgi:arsenate reductase